MTAKVCSVMRSARVVRLVPETERDRSDDDGAVHVVVPRSQEERLRCIRPGQRVVFGVPLSQKAVDFEVREEYGVERLGLCCI